MIKIDILATILNAGEMTAIIPDPVKIEAGRKRGKGQRGRKRGGSGLR